MQSDEPSLILASQSVARQAMLENAGVSFRAVSADIDEESIISSMSDQHFSTQAVAMELSKHKALTIGEKHEKDLVIGGDQILEFEGKMLTKAQSTEEAREKLKALRGKSHKLISAVSVAKSETVFWNHIDEAILTMRDFDDDFLDAYCERAQDALTRSVGAYELESYGARLFSSVQGDYFTILGMPLLPLLTYLQDYHGLKI